MRRPWLVARIRGALFALVLVLAIADGAHVDALAWIAAMGAFALAAQWRDRNDLPTRLLILAEATTCVLGGVFTGGSESPMLAYLPATTLAAGIAAGLAAAVLTAGVAAVVLLAGRANFAGDILPLYTAQAAEVATLALITGVLGGLLRRRLRDEVTDANERYAETYRLLEQLRAVTRRLPGSLDPGSVASNLITECQTIADFTRAGVFLEAGGSVLVPLALDGARRVPWRIDLDEPGPISEAWRTREPVHEHRTADEAGRRKGSHLLVLPITIDGRAIGVVVLETVGGQQIDDRGVTALWRAVEASALPLETSVLFDELRSSAALEERERLAKDMHDGIAQDLAYIGFELDALLAQLRDGELERPAEHALQLRRRITGLITDLRLSMSDLRSSTGPTRGLGAALSEYVRSIGTSSAITVHLSLAEGTIRLAGNTELELLRIAHEAIASARHRANVRNMWVTLTVDPPTACMVVEDDGDDDVFAHSPMDARVIRERADRIRATVDVSRRVPRGWKVFVELGGADADGPSG